MQTWASLNIALSAKAVIDMAIDRVASTVIDRPADRGLDCPFGSVVRMARTCAPADMLGNAAAQLKAPALEVALQEAAEDPRDCRRRTR